MKENKRAKRLSPLFVAVLAVLCLWGRVGTRLSEPFGGGHEGTISGRYLAGIMRAWHEGGFVKRRAAPIMTPRSDARADERLYANHPVASYYLFFAYQKLVGRSELGYRIFGLSLVSLFILLLARAASGLMNNWGLFGTLAAAVSSCLVVIHGVVPTYEQFLLPLGLLSLLLASSESPRSRSWLPLILFLAGSMDWAGFFLLLPVLLASRWSRGCWPALKECRSWFLATLLALLTYLLAICFWQGGLDAGWQRLQEAGGNALNRGVLSSPQTWTSLGRNFILDFGYGQAGFSLIGCLLLWRSKKKPRLTALVGASVLWCLMNVLAFPVQASWHEYWLWPISIAIALTCGAGIEGLARQSGLLALLALLLVIAPSLWQSVDLVAQQRREQPDRHAERFNRIYGDDVLYLIVGPAAASYYYFEGEVVDGLLPDQRLADLIRAWIANPDGKKTLVVMAPEDPGGPDPRRATWMRDLGLTLEQHDNLAVAWRRRD